ncbi:metallophosphoesterase family protein [Aestuariibius sp. 2305UL40-4]|uniref:metallophosphoesterase family protein n=1 Tax=Aestuariibius violaceus TaxID=3234132 RepID=UPI00345E1364
MKILAFSDLHLDKEAAEAIVAAAEDADLVIGAGDFAQRRDGLADYMAKLEPFGKKAIYVAGNNESFDELVDATSALCLQGDVTMRGNIAIGGIGGATPPLPPIPWESWDLTEDAAANLLDRIAKADILISHSPPKGAADEHSRTGPIGSTAVRAAVERLQPHYLLCGHVHDSWGQTARIGRTTVMNLGPTPNWIEI